MKLVLLMFLKEDEKCVNRLLSQQKVQAFSSVSVEGHGPGTAAGWTGEVQPYQSQMIWTILPPEEAQSLVDAVSSCKGVQDPRHPIRAALLDVQQFTCCDLGKP
jgi:hypothetical protein